MYEETLEDVQRIIELRTVTAETKARMILELIMDQDLKQRTDFEITVTEPKTTHEPIRRTKTRKNNKMWTKQEDLLLYQRYFESKDRTRTKKGLFKKLGKEFGRSPTAIEQRISKKGWAHLNNEPTKGFTKATNKDWEKIRTELNQAPVKKVYKKGGKKIPVTQTEIDTVHREKSMKTPSKQIAKMLDVSPTRVDTIDYKLRKGIYKTSKQKNKDTVEVGQSTSMPKKFRYHR